MAIIKGYGCLDSKCNKRSCWSPGKFEHRATTVTGSKATGTFTMICLHKAYHGCPDPIPEVTKSRKNNGDNQ